VAETPGTLKAEIAALRELVQREYSERREAEKAAQKSRDEVAKVLHEMTAFQNETRARLERIEPMADKLTRWQYIGTGVLLTFGALGAALGWMFHQVKDALYRAAGW
jgi:chromosome segregation ATPase